MRSSLFVALFVTAIAELAQSQTTRWTLNAPAHVFRVEAEAGATISGSLSWEGTGTNLSLCLLQGGSELSSTSCLQKFSVPSGNLLLFSHLIVARSAYFLRVDAETLGSTGITKYRLEHASSNPQSSVSTTAGIDGQNPHNIVAFLNTELSAGYHFTLSSGTTASNLQSSFDRYTSQTFAPDYQFQATLRSPGGAVTQLAAQNGIQLCFANIDKEVGEWYLHLQQQSLTASGSLTDTTPITLETAPDTNCLKVIPLGQSSSSDSTGLYAGGGGGAAVLLCLILTCCLCRNRVGCVCV